MAKEGESERGRVTDFTRAAGQIRAGSRLLVREVKELIPPLEEEGTEAILATLRRSARALEEGDYEEAEKGVDRCLAPLISGPGFSRRRRRILRRVRFLMLLALFLLGLGLLLFGSAGRA